MKKFSRLAAVMAGLLVISAGSQVALANCTNFGAGFPVFQCGFTSWFAPAPAGAGNITAAWWQIHYGNGTLTNGIGGTALEGTGNSALSTFAGNDSGSFQIVLTDAASVLPQYASMIPPNALCSNFENSWSQIGNDGCADNPRTTGDNDDSLNQYFDLTLGPGNYSTDRLIDYPMGVLLTESNGKYFALGFVANEARGADMTARAADTSEGFFNLGAVTNGDPNPVTPGMNNIIPWQTIPKQRVDATTFSNPADKQNSDRILALSWPAVRVVSDQSVRTSSRTLNNPGNGVGVADQGPLVRYVVEGAPITTATPDPGLLTWTPLTSTGATMASVQVAPDTAIRLRSIFGVAPATTATGVANCRVGLCGDLGYEVVSGLTIIAGPLASEKVVDLTAECRGAKCTIGFSTTSETSISSISILAIDKKQESVVKTVSPQQGTTGIGATYSVELSKSDLKGAKEIAVRLDGTGGSLITKSATVSIR